MTAGSNAGLVRYPGAGCVVEFLQGNTLQTAWVMEEQGGRLRLLLPNRRETSLAANRILPWAGPQYGAAKAVMRSARFWQNADRRGTLWRLP